MKVLSILSILALVCISSASYAQSSSPKLSGNAIYNELSFKNPIKPLLTADSISYSDIQTRLNLHPSTRKTIIVPSDGINSNDPQSMPSKAKSHIIYRDLDGKEFLKPRSSFGLMQY